MSFEPLFRSLNLQDLLSEEPMRPFRDNRGTVYRQ
jgi:hypothetical protein